VVLDGFHFERKSFTQSCFSDTVLSLEVLEVIFVGLFAHMAKLSLVTVQRERADCRCERQVEVLGDGRGGAGWGGAVRCGAVRGGVKRRGCFM
jgi:hypothetical protein